MQLWHLGLVSSLALGTVGSILVPTEVARIRKINGPDASLLGAKRVADRLFTWGFMIGTLLALVQLAALPLVNVFSPSIEVRNAARLPTMIAALLQLINGCVFVGEGIQAGNQYFPQLAATTTLAAAFGLANLKFGLLGGFGTLSGVWSSLAIFYLVRLFGVLFHHFVDGPLAPRNLSTRVNT